MLKNILLGVGLLLSLALGAIFIHDAFQEKPSNWSLNFKKYSKSPYGTYIAIEELKNLFPGQTIKRLSEDDISDYYTPYYYSDDDTITLPDSEEERFKAFLDSNDTRFQSSEYDNFNVLAIDAYLRTDYYSVNSLLTHVRRGNVVQIYSLGSSAMLDNKLEIGTFSNYNTELTGIKKERRFDFLLDSTISFGLKEYERFSYFHKYPDQAEVVVENLNGEVVGLKFAIGEGELYLFTIPNVLSNYEILYGDKVVAEALLSKFPQESIFWTNDLYFEFQEDESDRSLLSFIHASPALSFAYYILIIASLIFLLPKLFRLQKAIPVYSPPENLSLTHVSMVSKLYRIREDYRAILTMKMQYLLHEAQHEYRIDTSQIDQEFFKILSRKKGVKIKQIESLFRAYNNAMKANDITPSEFEQLCKDFQLFKSVKNGR